MRALDTLEQWRAEAEDNHRADVRWSLERIPLRVHIEPNPQLPGAEKELFLAARQWEAVSRGLIRFVQAGQPDRDCGKADIYIVWSNDTAPGREYEVGHTERTVQGQRIIHARITLIANPLIDSHLSPERQKQRLYATMLHETGHALGLEHSQEKTDVMHHRGWQRPYLSANDAKRLHTLYQNAHPVF